MLVPFWAWALSGKPQTAAAQLKRFFPTLPVGTPPKKIMFASFEDRRPPKTGGEMLADGDVFSQHFATGEAHWAYCCKHSLPRRAKLEDNCWYIYIYWCIYLEPICPLFLAFNPPKQGPFQSNKGHLGSMGIYIYYISFSCISFI